MPEYSLEDRLRIIAEYEAMSGTTVDTSHPWGWIRGEQIPFSRAVVIVGPTRSGTSAVAGALHFLGVKMCETRVVGDVNPYGTFEDAEFTACQPSARQGNQKWQFTPQMAQYMAMAIRNRNATYAIWGVKAFGLIAVLPALLPAFEDVRLVFTVRDEGEVRASYDRWVDKMGTPSIDDQLQSVDAIVDIAKAHSIPSLVVPYDDLLGNTEATIGGLAAFAYSGTGMEATPLEFVRAVQHIRPELRTFGGEQCKS